MTNIEIGHRIPAAREEQGLTRKDLAMRIQVSPSTITRYENGKIDKLKMPVIESIAKALGVNPMWLIGKSEHKDICEMIDEWNAPSCPMSCTDHEKDLIRKYRCLPPPVQGAVDAMIEGQYELVRPKLKIGGETS